jgi:hypothetical protein
MTNQYEVERLVRITKAQARQIDDYRAGRLRVGKSIPSTAAAIRTLLARGLEVAAEGTEKAA